MELIVDANCLLSAIIKQGKSRELICSFSHRLYAPEHIITEINNHREDVIEKAGISEDDFDLLMNVLSSNINIVSHEEFASFMNEAEELTTHEEDIPFIALALYKKLPVWSDDAGLKKQNKVKVYSTSELLRETSS